MANTTWSATDKTAGITLSGGNLVATLSATGNQGVRGADRQTSGKFYWEVTPGTNAPTNAGIGLAHGGITLTSLAPGTAVPGATWVQANGTLQNNGTQMGSAVAVLAAGSPVCFALDLDNHLLWVRVGAAGNWNNATGPNPATGSGGYGVPFGLTTAAYPLLFWNNGSTTSAWTANFGDSAFSGTVPSGFTSGFTAGATPANILVESTLAREVLSADTAVLRQSTLAREVLLSQVTQLWQSTLAREVLLTGTPQGPGNYAVTVNVA